MKISAVTHRVAFALLLAVYQGSLAGEGMTGDELKSKLKSSIHLNSDSGSAEDASLKLSEEDMVWWEDAKFGMFIHWGLYAIPGKGEWHLFRNKVPPEEYAKLADEFVGKDFDADAWARAAKDAGMNYMVLTARHHDGFALWNSPASFESYNSFEKAAQRDFVAEYVQACRQAGLGVGLYYSPMDWRFPGYFKPRELAENAALMKKQGYGQVKELMSNYGKIDVLWYDGGWLAHEGKDADAAWFWEPLKLNTMVRELQPKAVINPRSGWVGDFACAEGDDAVTGPIIDTPWEKCLNLNLGGWGFHPKQNTLSPQEVVRMLVDVVGRGGNMLLNVGPDADGVIPPAHVAILKEVGGWLEKYGESIYGTRAGPLQPVDGVYSATSKENRVFIHVINPTQNRTLILPPFTRPVRSYSVLSAGMVAGKQSAAGIELQLSGQVDDGFPAVVELVLGDGA
jgi:alpha-L-fucosidase